MNKRIIFSILILSALSVIHAGPGGGHSHSHGHSHEHKKEVISVLPESSVEVVAANCAYILAKVGKIDKKWKKAKLLKLEKIKAGDSFQWKSSFKVEESGSQEKKTLYIFLQTDGKYVAGNFTGK